MRVTDDIRIRLQETQQTLSQRKNGASWRCLGDALGVHFATLHAVAAGDFEHVSRDTLNRVRLALDLQPLPALLEVPPCEDCGSVHTGRCYNKLVRQVVVLGPGEVVAPVPQPKPNRPRPAAHRPYITSEAKWRAYLAWSRQYDEQEPTP